jgi:hypothetical protein
VSLLSKTLRRLDGSRSSYQAGTSASWFVDRLGEAGNQEAEAANRLSLLLELGQAVEEDNAVVGQVYLARL